LSAAAQVMHGGRAHGREPFTREADRLEYVHEQVTQAIGELVKRIDVLVKARKILLPKDETCPPQYQALVEYYYKVLSEFNPGRAGGRHRPGR
jgi:hypothetical protein